jgi:hypothetical protein
VHGNSFYCVRAMWKALQGARPARLARCLTAEVGCLGGRLAETAAPPAQHGLALPVLALGRALIGCVSTWRAAQQQTERCLQGRGAAPARRGGGSASGAAAPGAPPAHGENWIG